MPNVDTNQALDRRRDVEVAYDTHDSERLPTVTCAHCGKKTPVGKTTTAIGGGNGTATAGVGGAGGGGG